jgi:hypothetical protein
MLAEESTIHLMRVPNPFPPLGQEPVAAPGVLPGLGDGKPLPSAYAPTPSLGQAPALPRQFAALLAEVLAGVRPERQVTPWLSKRSTIHLHRLMPSFKTGHQPKVLRVRTTSPTPNVIEMTMIAEIGPRPRALAIRLEYGAHQAKWQCTDIESA